MKRLLIVLFITGLFACGQRVNGQSTLAEQHQINKEAVRLAKQAADTVMKSFGANRVQTLTVAINLLKKAITIDSSYFPAYRSKMMYETELKQYKNAVLTGKQMIKLRPMSPELYGNVGFICEKEGDATSSRQYFERSLVLYDQQIDAMKLKDNSYKNAEIGKAINLVMLGKEQQGGAIYKNLYIVETDTVYKQLYTKYMNMSKKDWLDLIDGRGQTTSTNAIKKQ